MPKFTNPAWDEWEAPPAFATDDLRAGSKALDGGNPCIADPRARHGFLRNASHAAGHYVCECSGFLPDEEEELINLSIASGELAYWEWEEQTEAGLLPNATTLEAMKEADEMMRHPSPWETFQPNESLQKALDRNKEFREGQKHQQEEFDKLWASTVLAEESDPHGIEQHAPGAKLDAGKNRLGLVLGEFSNALWAVGLVGTKGARKYTDSGWLEVPNGEERYTDAMLRHWVKEQTEGEMDMDTHFLHAAHTAWNALARLELMLRNRGLRNE